MVNVDAYVCLRMVTCCCCQRSYYINDCWFLFRANVLHSIQWHNDNGNSGNAPFARFPLCDFFRALHFSSNSKQSVFFFYQLHAFPAWNPFWFEKKKKIITIWKCAQANGPIPRASIHGDWYEYVRFFSRINIFSMRNRKRPNNKTIIIFNHFAK